MAARSSPFGSSSSQPGHGLIEVSTTPPSRPALTRLTYTYPLKLISPGPGPEVKCILVFLLTYGGGLISGDVINLSLAIAAASKLALVTQGSTKIFKASSCEVTTKQDLQVTIEGDGALLYLPDPVQPFGESLYEQRQVFRLDPDEGNLCVLDWVSEGRTARGEQWSLWGWSGRNEVWSAVQTGETDMKVVESLLLRDSIRLRDEGVSTSEGCLKRRMAGLGVFGTLIIRGKLFGPLGQFFLDEYTCLPRIGAKNWSMDDPPKDLSSREQWREARHEKERSGGVLWSAAAVRAFVVVKFGAGAVEEARSWLGSMIRQEGTVEREFGEPSLICLR